MLRTFQSALLNIRAIGGWRFDMEVADMIRTKIRKRTAAVLTGILVAGAGLVSAVPAQGATCANVDVVFARATGELPGLGIAGQPLVSSITSRLAGLTVSSCAVNYGADYAYLARHTATLRANSLRLDDRLLADHLESVSENRLRVNVPGPPVRTSGCST
jgi:Cutinase